MLQMEENEDFNKILNERLDSVTTDGECQQVLRPKACGSCGLLCDVFFLLMRSCCKQIVLIFPPPSPPPTSPQPTRWCVRSQMSLCCLQMPVTRTVATERKQPRHRRKHPQMTPMTTVSEWVSGRVSIAEKITAGLSGAMWGEVGRCQVDRSERRAQLWRGWQRE